MHNAGDGLAIDNQSAPPIQRNWILDNEGNGISLSGTSTADITQNEFWGNGGYAVYMDASCYPHFTGNHAYYNGINGIRVSGHITFNQTWANDLVYVVESELTVDSGSGPHPVTWRRRQIQRPKCPRGNQRRAHRRCSGRYADCLHFYSR